MLFKFLSRRGAGQLGPGLVRVGTSHMRHGMHIRKQGLKRRIFIIVRTAFTFKANKLLAPLDRHAPSLCTVFVVDCAVGLLLKGK